MELNGFQEPIPGLTGLFCSWEGPSQAWEVPIHAKMGYFLPYLRGNLKTDMRRFNRGLGVFRAGGPSRLKRILPGLQRAASRFLVEGAFSPRGLQRPL